MNKIKQLRDARGWTMETLAQACAPPTSASQINKLEKGQTKLHAKWLPRLAVAFRCSQADILGESAPPPQATVSMTSEQIQKLVYESALEAREVEAHLAKRKLKFAPVEFAKLAADRARIALLIRAENPGEDERWVKSATRAAFDNVIRNIKFGS